MLDGTILAGCVHRLEDEEHGPAILGIKSVLQFGQGQNSRSEGLLCLRFMFLLGEVKGIFGVHVFKAKVFPFGDTEGLRNFPGFGDDVLHFHRYAASCVSNGLNAWLKASRDEKTKAPLIGSSR